MKPLAKLLHQKTLLICGLIFIILLTIPVILGRNLDYLESAKTSIVKKKAPKTLAYQNHPKQPNQNTSSLRVPMNYLKSSETKPYPNLQQHPQLWIKVSLKKQRVYLIDQNKILYTMYASTGIEDGERNTPKGTYQIESERSPYFYSPAMHEGAFYAVSFLNHGIYLFHSTPTNQQQQFLPDVAADLGKRPSSHGCVHLTVADSKWVYDNIPYNTKVVIK
ncbi:MAG: L,D-transpeptidase [Lactobacillus sp.]|nr:L,D-transpeptidase [Lactobacillus sp.]